MRIGTWGPLPPWIPTPWSSALHICEADNSSCARPWLHFLTTCSWRIQNLYWGLKGRKLGSGWWCVGNWWHNSYTRTSSLENSWGLEWLDFLFYLGSQFLLEEVCPHSRVFYSLKMHWFSSYSHPKMLSKWAHKISNHRGCLLVFESRSTGINILFILFLKADQQG